MRASKLEQANRRALLDGKLASWQKLVSDFILDQQVGTAPLRFPVRRREWGPPAVSRRGRRASWVKIGAGESQVDRKIGVGSRAGGDNLDGRAHLDLTDVNGVNVGSTGSIAPVTLHPHPLSLQPAANPSP